MRNKKLDKQIIGKSPYIDLRIALDNMAEVISKEIKNKIIPILDKLSEILNKSK